MLESIYDIDYWKTYIQPRNFSLDRIPDLSSKTAIVTGGNSGLGYVTALELARQGAHVFLACRSPARANEAIEKIERELAETAPHLYPKVEFLQLDLADLRQVAHAAKVFLDKGIKLDILVNNAGVGLLPPTLSKDGIEMVFAINHMGPFLFTQLLLPRLIEAQPSRIVNVSSMSHELQLSEGGIQFGTLSQADGESPIVHYNRSKLANILYAKALARRLEEGGHDKVYVNAIHPGYVLTDIDVGIENTVGTVMAKFATTFRRVVGRDVEVGALTQLYCATSPEIEEKGLSGRYFVPDAHELRPSPYAMNRELQERLFKYSEEFMVKRGLLST